MLIASPLRCAFRSASPFLRVVASGICTRTNRLSSCDRRTYSFASLMYSLRLLLPLEAAILVAHTRPFRSRLTLCPQNVYLMYAPVSQCTSRLISGRYP